jgi:alkaline phosphatase
LSFQNLPGTTLVTTGAPVLQEASPGNHYSPNKSLLKGETSEHNDRQAELYMNACGFPWEFNPNDISEGGNMALWDDVKGGEFPWDPNYYTDTPDTSSGFDPEFIMQHATDSAPTASAFATGKKMAGGMMSQNLYERDVETILEEAIKCGKAAGVVSSVPMFHATPGAFIIHTNNRSNRDQLRTSWINSNPTLVLGMCGGEYYPFEETLQSMVDGSLSSQWTFLVQNNMTLAEVRGKTVIFLLAVTDVDSNHPFSHFILFCPTINECTTVIQLKDFYNDIEDLDPDNGDHLLVCLGGDFTPSGEQNMPYRGVDSTFSNRHCSSGEAIVDPDTGLTIGINVTTPEELCNHYEPEEIQHIPTIQQNVEAALNFLSKDDEGFFLMYEQGDIDWAAHANHMDDMLGAMLDIDDSVQLIMDWIEENGGWEKNALYVTADHDHYLTLNDHFPEALANLLIAGESHKMTPVSNTNTNAWDNAIDGGRHEDDSQSQTEHLADYATWSMEEQGKLVAAQPKNRFSSCVIYHSHRPIYSSTLRSMFCYHRPSRPLLGPCWIWWERVGVSQCPSCRVVL